jgi:iron complex outermembrane recepter protein
MMVAKWTKPAWAGVVSMLAMGHAAAWAQTTDTAPAAADEGQDIVVTGTAFQNQRAIQTRRASPVVVDSLVQDDTGDLPDQYLSEALARVPGVSTMQVLYGEQESQYVAVRGITPDLNYVSLDGIGMISVANQGSGQRRVDLALIPSQASSRTDVFKTFTADQEAGAIGGVINIVPYSAFDGRRDRFLIDANISYSDYADIPGGNSLGQYNDTHWGGGVRGLLTKRFGGNDQFGIVLSGSYNQRTYDETKRNPNGRTYYNAAGGSTSPFKPDWNGFDPAPTALVSYDFTNFVKTYGGTAAFEFAPDDHWYSSILAYDYRQTEDQTDPVFTLRAFDQLRNQTQHGGTLRVPDVRTALNYDRFETESRGVLFKTRYRDDHGTEIALRAAYNDNSFLDAEQAATYQAKPTNQFVMYDSSERSLTFSLTDPAGLRDASKYSLLTAGDTTYDAMGKAWEARLDVANNADGASRGFGIQGGVGLRGFEMDRDVTVTNYTVDKSPLTPVAYDPNFVPYLFGYNVLWLDYAKFAETVKPRLPVTAASSAVGSAEQDYDYRETIGYAYLSGVWATDTTRVIAGVRYDMADYRSHTPLQIGSVYQGGLVGNAGNYSSFLPSLNLVQDLSRQLRLKASYSRTIGRPAPEDIARPTTRNDVSFTIARGNPDLKPRRADNYDMAAEYYFNGGEGLVSLGGFIKDVKDDIYDLKEEQLIDGFTYTVTTPMNASASSLKGIEFQLIDNAIGWMPGFLKDRVGFSFNVTRTWGDMDYLAGGVPIHKNALLYQREWIGNAALFYQLPRKGELRVAYTYGDGYYDGIGADATLDRGPEARGQLDASARIGIADQWIVKLQAKNILGDDIYLGYGQNLRYRRAELNRARQFFVNLIFKP